MQIDTVGQAPFVVRGCSQPALGDEAIFVTLFQALDAILDRWRSPELLLDDLALALEGALVPKLGEHDEPRTQGHDHQDR
jgi:hypothetical protein